MRKVKSLLLVLISFVCFSCATTLSVRVPRPAQVDLNGAKSIAIEPVVVSKFVKSYDYTYTRQVTNYIETTLEKDLVAGGYYKVIGVKDRRTPADVYLDSTIVLFDVKEEVKEEKIKNPKYKKETEPEDTKGTRRVVEPEYIMQKKYRRSVRFAFKYQFVDGYTEKVIYSNELDYESRSTWETDPKHLEDPYSIIRKDVKNIVEMIERQVQPYFENRTLTLLEVKNNDDMKYADKLAEKGYLQESYNQFISVYNTTGLFEAGYNAAIILEAQGNYVEAKKLMSKLYTSTLDSRAAREIESINNELSQQNKLKEQENKRK